MTSALKSPYTSEAEYLAAELLSQEKNEYAGGQVFAMAGTSIRHNQISGNIYVALRAKASSDCRVSIADVKFKAKQSSSIITPTSWLPLAAIPIRIVKPSLA